MASEVDICNRALQKLGQAKITSLDDDVKAARECKIAYAPTRDSVFRDHPWNCLAARASLSALGDAPVFGYTTQYQIPDDCLRVVTVVSEFEVEWVVEGRRILTDATAPLRIVYVKQEADSAQYDALLVEALASRLAAELAESLTQSNTKRELAERAYRAVLGQARRADAHESSVRALAKSSWLDVRV